MNVMKCTMNFQDCSFYKEHEFSTGNKVPVFSVESYNGLNQIIGYAKYINSDATILYRGECKLHSSLRPSINHTITSQAARDKANTRLNLLISNALSDKEFSSFIKLDNSTSNSRYILESVLQHYGISTHCIDVVDNHWVALWFGQNRCIKRKNINTYYQYIKRNIRALDTSSVLGSIDEAYQYLVLLATEYSPQNGQGISINSDTITIDLRSVIPSVFLRPHAQHGWIIRKNPHKPNDDCDLSANVVAILRIRIDYANEWLGSGELLSIGNLFPSPAFDQGYDAFICRSDLFTDGVSAIAKYIY